MQVSELISTRYPVENKLVSDINKMAKSLQEIVWKTYFSRRFDNMRIRNKFQNRTAIYILQDHSQLYMSKLDHLLSYLALSNILVIVL